MIAYKRLLKHAKANPDKIKLHAGMMPWPIAVVSLRSVSASLGLSQALRLAKARRYINTTENGRGTKAHYNVFESFITGRDIHSKDEEASKLYEHVFKTNILRCSSMANKVSEILKDSGKHDRVLVICGLVNMVYGNGVPERIWWANPEVKSQSYLVTVRQDNELLNSQDSTFKK